MLKINKLELENIGTFKCKKSFEFGNGTTVLSGENGSGKSTILNMISLLLLNDYTGNLESNLNNKSDFGYAKLFFNFNNDDYVSSIEITKNKNTTSKKSLSKNGEDIASGEDVEKTLSKILPKHLTKYSLFRKQKGDSVTSVGDTDRRIILAQLCELNYENKIKSEIEPNIDALKLKISEKEKEEYSLKNKTYNFSIEKSVPIWNSEKENKLNELKEKQIQYKNNIENKRKYDELEKKINNAKYDLDRTESDYDINHLEDCKNAEIEQYKKEYEENLIINENSFNRDMNSYNSKKENLKENINNWEKELSNIKLVKLIKFDDSLLLKARNDLSEFKTKSKIAFDNANKLANKICPICGGNCEGKHDEFYNEGIELENRAKECEAEISDLENKKSDFDEKTKQNNENRNLKESLQNKINLSLPQIKDIENSIIELEERYNSKKLEIESLYKKNISNAENSFEERKSSATTIIKSKKDLLDSLESQIKEIEILEVENVDSEVESLETEYALYNDALSYNKAVKENNKKLKEEQKKDEVDLKSIESELIELKDSLAKHNLAKEIMTKTFPTWALDKMLDSIEIEINNFIDSVYYKSLNIKFEANKNALKMTFTGDDTSSRDLPIIKLSGAEEQIVNLAIMNVFNTRQELNCLIMDEVDSACDDKRKEIFYETLSEITKKYGQSIVITHSEKMRNKLLSEGANLIQL